MIVSSEKGALSLESPELRVGESAKRKSGKKQSSVY